MSRYVVQKNSELEIVVGYDNPLQTFFIQVIDVVKDKADEDDCIKFWAGVTPGEINDIQTLEQTLKPYLENLSPDIKERLRQDYETRQPLTPLQKLATRLYEKFHKHTDVDDAGTS